MYETVLLSTEPTFAILETCHQINTEAQPVLYQRPATFPSQAKFFVWLDRSSTSNLDRIRILRLNLTDIDLSPLKDARALLDSSRRISFWQLCSSALRKLQTGLQALRNLTNLTIIPPEHGQPEFYSTFYHPLLNSIRMLCPQLERLEIHDSEEVARNAPELRKIPDLTFAKRMPRPTLDEIEERRKVKHGVAVVDIAVLLGVVQEGRRAVSAPGRFTKVVQQQTVVGMGAGWPSDGRIHHGN